MYRTGGRLWTDEVQHGIPTLPPLRERQGLYGLCLLRHSLQHQENVFKDSQTDQKRGKYSLFWPVLVCLCLYPDFYGLRIGYSGKIPKNRSPEKYRILYAQKTEAAP
jgi:hypothetical protein